MNKKKMIKEIIEPYMVENGLVLEEQERGYWSWYKEIEGEDEYISIWDFDGRLSMTIGNSCRVSHVPAENLLSTLKAPRTTM